MDETGATTETGAPSRRPIRLVVGDDLGRSRLAVFFRLLLALPHAVWLTLWTMAVWLVAFPAWLVALFDGRLPRVFHDFLAAYVRYGVHVAAYVFLAANPFPGFTGRPGYDVDVEIDPPTAQGRWSVAFRLVLALPALLLTSALIGGGGWTYAGVAASVAALAWFAALVIGRLPGALGRFFAAYVRYAAHVTAFLYLVGGPFPGFSGASYPVDVTIEPAGRQRRLPIAFRAVLAVPALVVGAGYAAVLLAVAVLGWFAALVTGRMPEGLRNLGAAAVRYSAQVSAYLVLVTDRYPYSAPALSGPTAGEAAT